VAQSGVFRGLRAIAVLAVSRGSRTARCFYGASRRFERRQCEPLLRHRSTSRLLRPLSKGRRHYIGICGRADGACRALRDNAEVRKRPGVGGTNTVCYAVNANDPLIASEGPPEKRKWEPASRPALRLWK